MPEIPENVNTIAADDGTTWVEIASVGDDEEAKLLAGFLESEGIPAQVENVKFNMEPVNFGMMGDVRVYVPSSEEQRAQELMRQREIAYERLDDDGETVVTDDGTAEIADNAQTESDDGTES